MAAAPAVARPSDTRPAGRDDPGPGGRLARARALATPTGVAALAAVAAGVALRLHTASPLWLDEALTVNIAARPLGELPAALRHDGAPPLHYVLLHGWMKVFGAGDASVRLLPAVFSVLTIPLVWRMALRRGGPRAAAAAAVLVATSPFAIRYATEARMYSLVTFLVAGGWLALANALDDGSRHRRWWLAAAGLASGLLLLTHYWGFHLVAATVAALLATARWRPARRRAALAAAGAVVAGGALLFAPWLPSFAYQLRHTGTPWGEAPNPVTAAFTTLVDLGGGPHAEAQALAALLALLALLALAGRAVDGRRVEIDLRTRAGVRADAAVAAAAVLAGLGAGLVTDSAWASRYTAVAFPLVVLVAGHGMRCFADRRVAAAVLAVASVLGLAGGVRNAATDRTQAPQVADAVASAAAGAGGAVVAYCPDQLAPDVDRILRQRGIAAEVEQYTFPRFGPPGTVDWVDYERRMASAEPDAFARALLARAGGRDVVYVWMSGYRTLDAKCERVNDVLADASPGDSLRLVEPDATTFERHTVWVHRAR